MSAVLLAVSGLSKRFGGVAAVDSVDLDVREREIHAVIGPNGAGKTTLISLLSGALAADAGSIVFKGRDVTQLPVHERTRIGIARSFQITSVFSEMTMLENVSLAVQATQGSSLHRFWQAGRGDPILTEPAREFLAAVGLDAAAGKRADMLSHGEHRLLEIAITLACQPSLLLLDEPMAGLGPRESERMVEIVAGLRAKHAILLIEHDMDAVFALADRITVLVDGRVIRTGSPEEIRVDPEVRQAYLGGEGAGHA